MNISSASLSAAASSVIGKILKIFFGFAMVFFVVGLGVGIYLFFELSQKPSTKDDAVPFTITKGQTFSEITNQLYEKKLIRNTFVFRVRARLLGAENKVQAGPVTLRRNMRVDEILESITAVRLNDRDVTTLEGWRLEQIAQVLADKGWDRAKFIKAVREEDWQFGFLNDKPVGASVEGFLFPDTYKIPASYTEVQIVEMMLRRFGEQYDAQLRQKARDGRGIYQTVIMASIVEREAAKAEERPIIASVFYNRLKTDMRLDTDPTVSWARDTNKFANDNNFSQWWAAPTKEDLAIESPYNTYKVKGMPPGAICNPGLAALKAATEPATTNFYFFVATGDREGSHAFATTLDEHNQNVKKYQN